MYSVEILVDLPLKKSCSIYSYSIPDYLRKEVSYGKRVLIELGNRHVEGFIISNPVKAEKAALKPVLQVLDANPVFDTQLFEIASWMAERYICPLSTALRSMIPPILNRKKGKWLIPLCERAKLENELHNLGIEADSELLNELFNQSSVSIKYALQYFEQETIQKMINNGLIDITGKYYACRRSKAGLVYKIDKFDPSNDMDVLIKKAPRQAEIMKNILQDGEIDKEIIDQSYTASSVTSLLAKENIVIKRKSISEPPVIHNLLDEQKQVLHVITAEIEKRVYKEILLHGVTASGKTEVYINSVEKCIAAGRNAIVLVPEIALTRHLMGSFNRRFENMAVLHSGMADSERYEAWQRIKNREVNLVLGTRSAIFAPISDIGLIIIDEEHENTYKQEDNPKYHACEVARKRAELDNAVIVYGSATPAIDTFFRAMSGDIDLLKMSQRVSRLPGPRIHIQDMRKAPQNKRSCISELLRQKIQQNIIEKQQSILFLNRRGYSPITICSECGSVVKCPACSVGLNYHEDKKMNICHYCNYQEEIQSRCSSCGSTYIKLTGFGTQKVEKEAKKMFPGARIERLDQDSSRVRGVQTDILERMKNREIDILIGTQMVARGLDFPAVALVGIIDADSMLNIPDYRAGERAFQLIVQSSGRAGRGKIPGEVVIQTYNPDNPVINMAAEQDYNSFYFEEIRNRRLLNYPPFTNIMRIIISGPEEDYVEPAAADFLLQINDFIDAKEDDIDILGPAPCPIFKLRNRYRCQIILKCNNMLLLRSIGEKLVYRVSSRKQRVGIEINPLNMI